jgi:hypothetical protein
LLEALCTEQLTANWSFRLSKQSHRWYGCSHPLIRAIYILLHLEGLTYDRDRGESDKYPAQIEDASLT